MRDLGQLLNAHLGCTHKTTEVRIVRAGQNVTLTFRHGRERYKVAQWAIDIPESQHGSSVFHEAVRQMLDMGETEAHQRHPVYITDEEYARILDAS
jgi:hypothetical protein